MNSYVLTLIGNARSGSLETGHVEPVWQRLATTGRVDWLAENEACDLFFDSACSTGEITQQALDALSGTAFDAVCTLTPGRRKRLLISDMDSTIINQECIDELGDAIGVGAKIKAITAAVIRGDIGVSEALRQRLALMAGMERDLLEVVYESRISLQSGARTFVQTMRRHGAFAILVSGGFRFFTQRIAARVGFDDHQSNELAFVDDKLTGQVLEPILDRTAKLNTMTKLCREQGLTPFDVLAVGDGANDIKMIQAAGLGVAFHASPSVKKQANACIDHGDLTALLYIQGFRKSEFVHA